MNFLFKNIKIIFLIFLIFVNILILNFICINSYILSKKRHFNDNNFLESVKKEYNAFDKVNINEIDCKIHKNC